MLESKGKGRGLVTNFQLFNPESKSAKIQISLCVVEGGGGRGVSDQLPTFDAESKSAESQISPSSVRGGGKGYLVHVPTFDFGVQIC